MRFEHLEARRLLAATWRNPVDAVDVNNDHVIEPLDALAVINGLNRLGFGELPQQRVDPEAPFYDVTGDGSLEPIDALRVINALNRGHGGGYSLQETDRAATELSVHIGLGQPQGSRTYRFEVDARFDQTDTSSVVEDTLAVYLKDPQDPSTTLLDRGVPGTSLFTLSGDEADYPPGLVRFDGQTVEIDLTDVEGHEAGRLVFQLIRSDDDAGTVIDIQPLTNEVDPDGNASPSLLQRTDVRASADELDIAGMTRSDDLPLDVFNIRFDRASREYRAALKASNRGEAIGRDVAVVFPGLPDGVTLVNRSGLTADGSPYLNLRSAIRSGGLGQNAETDPVELVIETPRLTPFSLVTETLVGLPNQAPSLEPLGPFTMLPGEVLEVPLEATDPDGDRVTYSLTPADEMPTTTLRADGTLVVSPSPDQVGSYAFGVSVSDGSRRTYQMVSVTVEADLETSTRVSGRVLDVDGSPLDGLQVEIGSVQGLTDADGAFTLDLGSGPVVSNTLKIRGETYPGDAVYPFIAEKLPLVLEHDLFAGANNVIRRPIFLPKLDVVGGTTVDPATDTMVEQEFAPGETASVFVEAGTLMNQQGTAFDGVLSITEVPPELTPAALPANLLPDTVVTIQPGEMVFAQPAPLTFPNRSNWPPGTLMDLWSINPVTGEFEIVGEMVVSTDGTTIDTTSGGVRNSSWHFPAPPPEEFPEPDEERENKDDECERDEDCKAATSNVLLHSGAIREHHGLVSYQSLGEARSLALRYHSQRADPRPIVHFGVDNPESGDERRIVARLTFLDGDNAYQVPGASAEAGLSGGEHFWRVPIGAAGVRMAIQGDLQTLPTGIYDFQLDRGNLRLSNGRFTGTMSTSFGEIVHVNSIDSPFGAGWDLVGIQRLHEHRDGSLLLVNGSGGTLRFRPTETDGTFSSPAGDCSTLSRNADGTYTRTMPDRTVHQFESDGRLITITDRNGNQTQHVYSEGKLLRIVDPVGLETSFAYSGDRISTITDPAGRVTRLEHDANGNLVQIIDPDGSARTFDYDDRHLPMGETDQNGNRERTNFGFHGRATGSVRKDGTTLTFSPLQTQALFPAELTRSPQSAPLATLRRAVAINSRPSGSVTTTVLDQAGQRVSSRDSVGNMGQVSRNTDNLISAMTDARGFDTRLSYDAFGNVTQVSDSIAGLSSQTKPLYEGQKFVAGAVPVSIASADVNGDGIPDLVTANLFSDDISVLLGNGEGNFAEHQRFAAGNGPMSVAIGDVNGDGIPDLVTSNGNNNVLVRLGNGDGTFVESQQFDTGNRPQSIAIADVNGDESPDLVTANFRSNDVSVLLGNGDGTFAEHQRFAAGNDPTSVAIDDVNGDGIPDLVTANHLSNDVSVLLGHGDGTFAEQQQFAAGFQPQSIAVSDVNSDGVPDLVTANLDDVSVLLGHGEGTFAEQQRFAAGRLSRSIAIGDVNDDGIPDLVTANSGSSDVSVLLGNGDGTFADQQQFAAGNGPASIAIVDVNGDGIPDLATANSSDMSVSVLLGNGDGTFAEHPRFATGNGPASIAIGDLNGDRIPDLATANSLDPSVSVLLGNGDGTFAEQQQLAAGNVPLSIAIDDVNGDGIPDLATANVGSDDVSVLLGSGDGTFAEQQQFAAGNGPGSIAIGDVNGDGIPDLVTANSFSNDASVLLGNGDGTFAEQQRFAVGNGPGSIAVSDVNGDGIPDLLTANSGSNDVSVLLGNASESTSSAMPRRMTYDLNFNQLESVRDELGRLRIPEIDPPNGNPLAPRRNLSSDNGEGGTGDNEWLVTYTYTSHGQLASSTDPLGRTTDYAYDNLGRLLSVTVADGTADEAVTQYEYDLVGNLTAIVDANGNRSEFTYDAMNRPVEIREPDPDVLGASQSQATTVRYDQRGNVIEHTDSLGQITLSEYDPLDRLIRVTDNLGQQTHYGYDKNGNRASVTDANGNTTVHQYDARDRRIHTTDPDGGITSFRYDSDDNLILLTDPVGNTTRFAYDARGRLIRELDPTEKELLYRYDAANNLIQKTDRNGRVTEYEYDDLNRLTTEVWVNPDSSIANTIEYAYDFTGNLLSVIDVYSALSHTYDDQNRMLSVDNAGTPKAPHVVLNYTYDALGNVTSVSEMIEGEAGATTEYTYDGRSRMVSIQQSGPDVQPKLVDFIYNELGQFEELSRFADLDRNSLVARTRWSYDELHRLASLEHGSATTARDLAFYDYEYDAANRITAITDIDGRTDYSYDDRDQLTGALRGPDDSRGNESYTFDANGNRISSHRHGDGYVTDTANRLLSDGTYNYEYDNEGNMTRKTDIATGAIREFQWDHRNRLVAVTDFSAGGIITSDANYTYDALNRRIAKTVDAEGEGAGVATTEHYVYDGEHVALEFTDADGPGAAEQPVLALRNLFGPGIDRILAQEVIVADGTPVGTSGGTRWLLTDHLGTVRDIVDDTGTLLNHILYDSFGNILNQTDPLIATRYAFTGREFDVETGLHYYRARYYDAGIGRFVSEDPIGFGAGDPNVYRYVLNQPNILRDPSGLHPALIAIGKACEQAAIRCASNRACVAAIRCASNPACVAAVSEVGQCLTSQSPSSIPQTPAGQLCTLLEFFRSVLPPGDRSPAPPPFMEQPGFHRWRKVGSFSVDPVTGSVTYY